MFCCLYLDNRHRLMAFEELFRGTIDRRQRASARGGAAGARAQRGRGDPRPQPPFRGAEPSQADELITRRLKEALALVDVRVLDHLIVGDGRCFSFAERGLL